MAQIIRADSLYKQLADVLRQEIADGVYGPGDPLPSEAQMIQQYGVSRTTLRQALIVLRSEGLTEARHGKGTFVRDGLNRLATVLDRPRGTPLQSAGEARIHRQDADAATARLLNLTEGAPLFVCEATAADPTTGRKVLTRTVLPFASIENTQLEDDPFPGRDALITALATRHGKLTTTERVAARMPNPDETTALALPDITPVFDLTLITSAKTGPLLAETETISAEGIQLAYTPPLAGKR